MANTAELYRGVSSMHTWFLVGCFVFTPTQKVVSKSKTSKEANHTAGAFYFKLLWLLWHKHLVKLPQGLCYTMMIIATRNGPTNKKHYVRKKSLVFLMGASASPCHLVQLLCTALYTLSEFYVKRVSLLESATKIVVSNCAKYCNQNGILFVLYPINLPPIFLLP